MSTETELAYTAGILDGEGSISILKSSGEKRHFLLMIQITNTNREVLEWLMNKWHFGHISKQIRKENQKPSFSYVIKSRHAKSMLSKVLPYLIIKKTQARLGIAFEDDVDQFHTGFRRPLPKDRIEKRSLMREQMMRLNGRFLP